MDCCWAGGKKTSTIFGSSFDQLGGALPSKGDEEDGGRAGDAKEGPQCERKSWEETREVEEEEEKEDEKLEQVKLF